MKLLKFLEQSKINPENYLKELTKKAESLEKRAELITKEAEIRVRMNNAKTKIKEAEKTMKRMSLTKIGIITAIAIGLVLVIAKTCGG